MWNSSEKRVPVPVLLQEIINVNVHFYVINVEGFKPSQTRIDFKCIDFFSIDRFYS